MSLLSVATSSLSALRAALDSASHNVANVNTEGYTRQIATLKTLEPQFTGGGYVGTGVELYSISRVNDPLLDDLVLGNITTESYYKVYSEYTGRVNALLSDNATSLTGGINDFFNALQSSNQKSLDTARRSQILSSAEVLVDKFKSLYARLQTEISNINQQISQVVTQINGTGESLTSTSQAIAAAAGASGGAQPNDLLDTKDQLVRVLGELVNVSVSEQTTGETNVLIGRGQPLIISNAQTFFKTKSNENDPSKVDIVVDFGAVTSTDQSVSGNFTGGKLGALQDVKSKIIDPTLNALGRLAITLADAFNNQHKLGLDLNNSLGINFFNDVNDLTAQINRVESAASNTGTGILNVSIKAITKPDNGPYTLTNTPGSIANSSTLSTLAAAGNLSINGVDIRATVAGDDALSTTDKAASAIAMAKAINETSSGHGIIAEAQTSVVYLGTFTAGAIAGGQFSINGQAIVTAGTNETTLLQAINQYTATTGVIAKGDGSNHVTLYAADGRNIRLVTDGNSVGGNFSNLSLTDTVAKDRVQRAQLNLNSTSKSIVIAGTNPSFAGLTAGSTPADTETLTTSNYTLARSGVNYTLTRLSDNTIVATGSSPNLSADGFSITLASGSISNGDSYTIRPTYYGSDEFALNISDINKIALSSPIRALPSTNPAALNAGNGQIKVLKMTNTSGLPSSSSSLLANAFGTLNQITPPIKITFITDNTYQVYNASNNTPIGSIQSYNSLQENPVFPLTAIVDTASATNTPVTYDPGYRVNLSGSIKAGDTFTIDYNFDGYADNINGNALAGLAQDKLLDRGASNLAEAYNQFVSTTGTNSARAKKQFESATALKKQSVSLRSLVAGVNLDEEIVNILRLSQNFQASSRLIAVQKELFDSLIAVVR
ncbi:MAG: flagellar hook-associated protein FlgK [Gammaproteobacteria bacterium]